MKTPAILLLSTDPFVERSVREAVAGRYELRVIQATRTAHETLKVARGHSHVAIIDLDPGMHGNDLLAAAHGTLPVIVLTSQDAEHVSPLTAPHGGIVACLEKPVQAKQIRTALDRASGSGRNFELAATA